MWAISIPRRRPFFEPKGFKVSRERLATGIRHIKSPLNATLAYRCSAPLRVCQGTTVILGTAETFATSCDVLLFPMGAW